MNIVRPTSLEELLSWCKQKDLTPDDVEIVLGHEVMADLAERVIRIIDALPEER